MTIHKYYMPTRVIKGKDCIRLNNNIFKTLGKKALIVTGPQSAKRNGSEKDIITTLASSGIQYQVFDKVMSNPTIACAYEGAKFAKENEVDFIVAIGGGSPMDAGKAIALLAAQDIAEENLFSGQYENKVLPMAFVPTTAGTGSEVTQYAILTNDKAQTKTSIASDVLFPTVAFLDAKYTEYLPIETTINTAIDALSHAIEGLMTIKSSTISNTLAAESIRMIMDCIPDLLQILHAEQKDKKNGMCIEKRQQLLEASCLAGIVIAQTGTTVVHSMGYSLTYFRDTDHGKANGLLLPEYLRFVQKTQPDLVGRILETLNLSDVALFQDLMDSLLGEKDVPRSEEFSQYSKIAIRAKNIANCIVKPNESDIYQMFDRSFTK